MLFFFSKVGNLFGSRRSTIITLYNGAFGSSSAIFLFFKVRHGYVILSIGKSTGHFHAHVHLLPSHCFVFCPCSWYMNLASLSKPPSSSCQRAASFTCSELYSSCQEKSFHTRCLTTTHTGIDDVHQKRTTFFNQFFQKHFWSPLKNRVNILYFIR